MVDLDRFWSDWQDLAKCSDGWKEKKPVLDSNFKNKFLLLTPSNVPGSIESLLVKPETKACSKQNNCHPFAGDVSNPTMRYDVTNNLIQRVLIMESSRRRASAWRRNLPSFFVEARRLCQPCRLRYVCYIENNKTLYLITVCVIDSHAHNAQLIRREMWEIWSYSTERV